MTFSQEVSGSEEDLSGGVHRPESLERPVLRISPFFAGLSICLGICLLGGVYIGKLVREVVLDGNWVRLALIAPVPLLFMISLFFFQTIFSSLFQMIGPIGGAFTNSRFYSCKKPSLQQAYSQGFTPPRISIQMPVYKEGLDSVIIPTVRSLQQAISYYESHGGSANIFINDDGLRAGIPDEDCRARRDFYDDNHIGWVARPKHNGDEGYIREGKFKKASNMNFALNVSQKVEAYMQELVGDGDDVVIGEKEEADMYQQSLSRVLKEDPLAWAEGNIRVGEIILIVDSDTRVVSAF
jgi:cellulose synthase/poly-beta-1,6-N-acetylglucosamine synthase-like glycosyltransferase